MSAIHSLGLRKVYPLASPSGARELVSWAFGYRSVYKRAIG